MGSGREIGAVLFDLDGTLVDSAPDLVGALAWLREQHGLEPIPYQSLRHHASRGALGLIQVGFADQPDLSREELRGAFLARYAEYLWHQSHPFEGIESALARLHADGMKLGVVTNKPSGLAEPLIAKAGWSDVFGCVVGGNSTPRPKPDPAPVLEACRRLGVHPCNAIMIGDDFRDIEAGRRAACATAVAAWGYVPPEEDPLNWQADHVLQHPRDIFNISLSNNEL